MPAAWQNAVVVVDEAGLASNQQGADLLERALRANQRIVFVGDTRQHKALSMTALCATLHNPLLKASYQRLKTQGEPAKVVLTAVMRKLLPHLNSLLKTPLQITA